MNKIHGQYRYVVAALLTGLIASLAICQPANAQTPSPQAADDDSAPDISSEIVKDIYPDGIWPSDALVQSFIKRWAIDAGRTYNLRPDQQAKFETQLLKRWPEFLKKNRQQLQPLLNEYFETRLAMKAPTSEHVADWAERAMPVLTKLRQCLDQSHAELRPLLDSEQQAKLDSHRLRIKAGLFRLDGKLRRWRTGNFRESEWWLPPAEKSDALNAIPTLPQKKTLPPPPLSPDKKKPVPTTRNGWPVNLATELDSWTKHVADFCDRLQLDNSQRNAADTILKDMLQRATDYINNHLDQILKLESQIENPLGEDKEKVVKKLQEIYGPLDTMFKELDQRINKLPTTAQFRRAQQQQKEHEQKAPDKKEKPVAP